jgi:hypothetical protein
MRKLTAAFNSTFREGKNVPTTLARGEIIVKCMRLNVGDANVDDVVYFNTASNTDVPISLSRRKFETTLITAGVVSPVFTILDRNNNNPLLTISISPGTTYSLTSDGVNILYPSPLFTRINSSNIDDQMTKAVGFFVDSNVVVPPKTGTLDAYKALITNQVNVIASKLLERNKLYNVVSLNNMVLLELTTLASAATGTNQWDDQVNAKVITQKEVNKNTLGDNVLEALKYTLNELQDFPNYLLGIRINTALVGNSCGIFLEMMEQKPSSSMKDWMTDSAAAVDF